MTPEERYNQVAALYSKNNPTRKNVLNQGLGYKQKPLTGPQQAANLRSLFAAEGPEAAGTFVRIPGADQSPGGRLNAIMSLADNLDFKNQDALEGYLGDIAERTMGYEGLSIPVEGLVPDEGGFFGGGGPFMSEGGQQFGFGKEDISEMEKAYRSIQDMAVPGRFENVGNITEREILANEAALLAPRELLGEEDAFKPSALDEIGELLTRLDAKPKDKKIEPKLEDVAPSPAETLEATLTGGRGDIVEKPGERAAYLEAQKEKNAKETGKEIDSLGPDAAYNAFFAAMKDVSDSPPRKSESKKDAIARYRKEFEEATGIDASGKIDKSRALQAWGLALLKNKAGGKGFSGVLEALGEAGEAAMPYLDKATADSKAAQLAAGKYALQQRRADVDSELASAKANKDFQKEIYLKWYASDLKMKEQDAKANIDAQLKILEAQTTGGDYSKTKDRKFVDGQGSSDSWKIPYVYDSKNPNGGFYLKPEAAIRKHILGREGVVDARETISALRTTATEIAQGGGTVQVAYQKLHSLMKAIAPSQYLTGDPTDVEDYNYETKKLLNQYKRFLTQETGNGISNRDVEMWTDDLMGNIGFFTNLDATLNALDGLDQIFGAKQNDFDNALEDLLDPSNHQEGTYDNIVEKYGTFEDLKGLGSLVFVDGKLVRK